MSWASIVRKSLEESTPASRPPNSSASMATAIRTPAAPGTTPVVPKLVPAVPRILSKQGCFAPAAPGKVRDLNDNSTSSTPDTQSVPSTNDSESSASSSLPAPGVSLLNRKCKFPQLHDQMVGLTDKEAMQHALEIKSTENGSTDIVICAIDLEWHDVEPRELTEIGLAILDTRDFHGLKDGPGANGENLMKQVQFYHYRIKEHGHMENKYCIGHPERFEWGTTMWVSKEEAKDMIIKYFTLRTNEADKTSDLRPVLFLGHAIGNDEKEIKKGLGLDMADLGTIVKTVDTQVIARNLGLGPRRGRRTIGLESLCNKFKINPTELHNAGNDIAYSMLCALLMGYKDYEVNELREIDDYDEILTLATSKVKEEKEKMTQLIHRIKEMGRLQKQPTYGVRRYCIRCSAEGHFHVNCRERVRCQKCEKAKQPWRTVFSHQTDRCLRYY